MSDSLVNDGPEKIATEMAHAEYSVAPHTRAAMIGFRAGTGGFGRVMANIANGLVRQGVQLDLLLPQGEHPDLAMLSYMPQVHYYPSQVREQTVAALVNYLVQFQPVAVLGNRNDANCLLVEACARSSAPTRIVLRVGTTVREKLRSMNLIKRRAERRRLVAMYRAVDAIVGNSRGVVADLECLLGKDRPTLHVIYNPLDFAAAQSAAVEEVSHPWFVNKREPIVISVGRLAGAKNFPLLVEAFARVSRDRPCRLVIFGEGGQRSRLMRVARRLGVGEKCAFPGQTANPFAYMRRADVFVLSSNFEGSPNALVEALAIGVPIVSCDCPSGPREILADGRFGRLVSVRDAVALAEAIAATLDEGKGCEVSGDALARFDIEVSTRAYYEVLLGKR